MSVHFLMTSSANRAAEAAALVDELGSVVAEGDYVVVGGDLRTTTRTEDCITNLAQIVVAPGVIPVDQYVVRRVRYAHLPTSSRPQQSLFIRAVLYAPRRIGEGAGDVGGRSAGVSSRDGVDGTASKAKRCELLRDHMVDMRLGAVDAKDLAKHREVLHRALGDTFVTSCTTTTSDDDITCALGAADVTAAAGCTGHNAKH